MPPLKLLRRGSKVTNLVRRLYSDFQEILYVFLLRGKCKPSFTCNESSAVLQFRNWLNVARHGLFRVPITSYDVEGKGCGSLLELLLSPEWFPCSSKHWLPSDILDIGKIPQYWFSSIRMHWINPRCAGCSDQESRLLSPSWSTKLILF